MSAPFSLQQTQAGRGLERSIEALERGRLRADPSRLFEGLSRPAAEQCRLLLAAVDGFMRLTQDAAYLRSLRGRLLLLLERPAEASAEFESALRAEPARVEWAGRRGEAALRLGRWEEARSDLTRALRARPDASGLLLRAACWQGLGRFSRALADLRRALALEPARPEIWALRGRIHFDQGQYGAAARSLTRALALEPSLELHELKASVCLISNRYRAALKELDAALALAPPGSHLRMRRLRALAALGRTAQAWREVERMREEGRAAWAQWGAGVLHSRAASYGDACRSFAEAQRLAQAHGAPDFAEKCAFFLAAARVLDGRAPKPQAARLQCIGLGMRHPWQITAEALPVLAGAELVLNNLSDPDVAEFLALFPARVQDIVFRKSGDLAKCRRQALRAVRAHERVVFLTRGNPVVFGPLARMLFQDCAALGMRVRALPSLTTSELLLERAAPALGGAAAGLQILGKQRTAPPRVRPIPGVPILLYTGSLLEAFPYEAYPAPHPCYLFGPGDAERALGHEELRRLSAVATRDQSVTYFIPPAGAKPAPPDTQERLPDVLVCGLGVSAPRQVTLETLRELARCRTVFCDERLLPGLEASGFLSGGPRLIGAAAADAGLAALIAAHAGGGAPVGYVGAGHPVLFSGHESLVRGLAERGLRCRLLAALSPMSVFASSGPVFFGLDCLGIQVARYSDVAAAGGTLDHFNPVLIRIDAPVSADSFMEFRKRLSRQYPPERALTLREADVETLAAPASSVGAAAALLPELRPGRFLAIAGEALGPAR